jgi:hypothetical protein
MEVREEEARKEDTYESSSSSEKLEEQSLFEEKRRSRQAELNLAAQERDLLKARVGIVWDTDELAQEFEVLGFMAPFVVVKRRADGVKGSLEFQARPRYYFNFKEDK